MNVPPTCECYKLQWVTIDEPCGMSADFVVVVKSQGKILHASDGCLMQFIQKGQTYSIFPAKDYSMPKRSFDREYMGEPFVPDGSRCIRCDGEMAPLGRSFPFHKSGDVMVCKECGGREG